MKIPKKMRRNLPKIYIFCLRLDDEPSESDYYESEDYMPMEKEHNIHYHLSF